MAVSLHKPGKRTLEWGMSILPNFKGLKAYILGGAFYGDVVRLFASAGFEKADTVEEADIVVFIGGADIDPALYGHKAIAQTQTPSYARDKEEQRVYDLAVDRGIPCIGICRGAQLLHALNGGELWQHVENHSGPNHQIYDIELDLTLEATSLHHQMLMVNRNIELVAVCVDQVSKRFLSDDIMVDLTRDGDNNHAEIEIEAGIYWDTKCFFVQGHPEVGSSFYKSWFMHKIEDFLEELIDREQSDNIEKRAAEPLTGNVPNHALFV